MTLHGDTKNKGIAASSASVYSVMASTMQHGKKKFKIDPNALCSHVSDSLYEANCLKNKISEISSINVGITADSQSVEVFLICRFGLKIVQEVVSMLSSARFLPGSVVISKVARILGICEPDVKNVIHLFEKAESFNGSINTSKNEELNVILTPPTSICFDCQQQLVVNHAPTEVRIYTLKGFVNGEKWSLRCNGCKSTYNYSKYGSRNGWKMYPNQRTLVESSDCCFFGA